MRNIILGLILILISFGGTFFAGQIFNYNKVNQNEQVDAIGFHNWFFIAQRLHYDSAGTIYSSTTLKILSTDEVTVGNAIASASSINTNMETKKQSTGGSTYDMQNSPALEDGGAFGNVVDFGPVLKYNKNYYDYAGIVSQRGGEKGSFTYSYAHGWTIPRWNGMSITLNPSVKLEASRFSMQKVDFVLIKMLYSKQKTA